MNDLESQEERMPCTDRVDLDDLDMGVVRRTFHDLIVQNHIVTTVFTLKVLVYFVYFQFCVSDHSAKIAILSRTPNVDYDDFGYIDSVPRPFAQLHIKHSWHTQFYAPTKALMKEL